MFDDHPELLHDVQGDIDVGLGDQLSLDVDAGITGCHRRRHQKRRQELAGNGTVDVYIAAPQPFGIHHQRRKPVFFQVLDMGTRFAQGIHQMANGTLFHTRLAAQSIFTGAETQRGAERTHGGTGVAEEQIDRLFHRKAATQTVYCALGLVGGELVLDPELGQRRQHMTNVIAVEQVSQTGSATGQRRQQQRTVRDTLGAGKLTSPATREMGSKRNEFIDFLCYLKNKCLSGR